MQVLIIDDHPALRRGIGQLLTDIGWTIEGEAGSLKEARALVHLVPWTLAILDLHLPDGDGFDLLSDFREAGFKQPILVHSMLPDASVASRVFRSGGSGYLNKGSSPEELVLAARKVAAGGRYVSPEFAEELAMGLAGGADAGAAPHEQLSQREYQVMCLTASGKTPTQIAEVLGCNINSISTYRARILKKLKLKTSLDIVRYALNRRLVTL